MKTLQLAIILCTSALFASSAYLQLDKQQAQLSKEQCMGGSSCPGAAPFPSASVGNRTLDLAVRLYSNTTMPTGTHYLWFRFFDANTNQTIRHVSFFSTITQEGNVLFRELLHTHTGILNVKVVSTTSPSWNVTASHEPILNGWVPYNDDEPIVVQAPVFNDPGTEYHLSVQMFSIDRDNNIFDNSNPYSVPNFDLLLGIQDLNKTIIIGSAHPPPIRVENFRPFSGRFAPFDYFEVGKPISIQADAENISPKWQHFSYITEVFDNQGRVESIQWHNQQLDPLQSAALFNSWTPSKAGNYTVEAFVWGNFTGYPVPLANSLKTSLEVR
ncbi:MAG: hypothetical protein KGI33_11665 [Thaumarchaeota archaeon]|nr:hypothetical protein [Nitrososphaerota archaeon]